MRITLFLVLSAATLTSTQLERGSLHINITNSQCGKVYDAGWFKNIYLDHHGSDVLKDNPCSVEIENKMDNLDMVICITVQSLSVSCDTTLEYHSSFIKSYNEPEKKVTCYDVVDKWCTDQYIQRVFIVLKKPATSSSDIINLRLYKEYFSTSTERFSGTNIFLVAILPAVFIGIFLFVTCYCAICRKSRVVQARRARFQTTMENVRLQPGQSVCAPMQLVSGYQTVSQADHGDIQLNLPPGYNVHPVQRAVPMDQSTGQADGNHPQPEPSVSRNGNFTQTSHNQQQSTAQALDLEEPPPSYTSLWR